MGYFASQCKLWMRFTKKTAAFSCSSLGIPKVAEERNWLECTSKTNMQRNHRLSPSPAAAGRDVTHEICSTKDARTIWNTSTRPGITKNVYDYAHFLDPWAALGYNIGETCLFGNGDRNATESRAYKYCSKFVGYPASVVVGRWVPGLLQDSSWADDFDACRYFSHYLQGIIQQLSSDEELKADGTTVNGCTRYEGWPLGDKRCPIEDDTLRKIILAVIIGISFACLLFVILVVLCICRWYRCGVYQRKGCCCGPYDDVAGIDAPQWKSKKTPKSVISDNDECLCLHDSYLISCTQGSIV